MKFDPWYNPFPSQRNVIYGSRGMVATSHPLAAQAGLEVLKKGGNAVDAAIATAAALTGLQGAASMVGIMIVPPLIGCAGDLVSMEALPVFIAVQALVMFAALLKTGCWPANKAR